MAESPLDEHYIPQWVEGLAVTLLDIEETDRATVKNCTDGEHVHSLLSGLLRRTSEPGPGVRQERETRYAVSLILSTLPCFRKFEAVLLQALDESGSQETTALWGLLTLSTQLASQQSNALIQLGEIIKSLSLKVDIFNSGCLESRERSRRMTEAALDLHLKVVRVIVDIIQLLKSGERFSTDNSSWKGFEGKYSEVLRRIEMDVVSRIDRLAIRAQQNASRDDLLIQRSFLSHLSGSRGSTGEDEARLPCVLLPQDKNSRFYDREESTSAIDHYFFPIDGGPELRTVLLYGIGGVGKSYVALKYAYMKKSTFQAILWLKSDSPAALSQSFTDAAIHMNLEGSFREGHDENRIVLLSWLQRSEVPWLLVFDNAESLETLLPYKPQAFHKGCILITSRNQNLVEPLADIKMEIQTFGRVQGSELLMHCLRKDVATSVSEIETSSALELSEKVGGHALAISNIAGLIDKKTWSIKQFTSVYEEKKRQIHGTSIIERGSVSIEAIWKLSFESLDFKGASLLGLLVWMNPDAVPHKMFIRSEPQFLPKALEECSDDEWELSNVAEPLLELPLVLSDSQAEAYSTHRLIQTEFRHFMGPERRQTAFEETVNLLRHTFGLNIDGQMYDRWEQCQMCMQQILSLKENFKKERRMGKDGRVQTQHWPVPTLDYCRLLIDSTRYLEEVADFTEQMEILEHAQACFAELPQHTRESAIHVDREMHMATSQIWAYRGDFAKSLQEMHQAETLTAKLLGNDVATKLRRSRMHSNLANVLGSAGRYEEALERTRKAEEICNSIDVGNQSAQKWALVLHQNIARWHVFLGQTTYAKMRIQVALEYSENSGNWAMWAFTLFVQAMLNRQTRNLEAAILDLTMAQSIWLSAGKKDAQGTWTMSGGKPLHHFNAACLYKLGCVTFDVAQAHDDIREYKQHLAIAEKYLRDALVAASVKKHVMAGDYGRILHKLSRVLQVQPGKELEAAEKASESQSIFRGRAPIFQNADNAMIGAGKEWGHNIEGPVTVDEDDTSEYSESAFDDLVYVLWR